MKAKHGAPHLEKLRYDYQLLHDAYSMESPRYAKLASLLVIAGLAGFIGCALLYSAVLWGVL